MFKIIILNILFVTQVLAYSNKAEEVVKTRDIEKESSEIKFMEQVKKELHDLVLARDACGVGSCHNSCSFSICDYLALVDIRLNGALGIGMISDKEPGFITTKSDVRLLKRMIGSCKMTSYQYWNYPQLIHITYDPSKKDEKWINQQLGIKLN